MVYTNNTIYTKYIVVSAEPGEAVLMVREGRAIHNRSKDPTDIGVCECLFLFHPVILLSSSLVE